MRSTDPEEDGLLAVPLDHEAQGTLHRQVTTDLLEHRPAA